MDMTQGHYAELIRIALNKRSGWVPIGPLDAVRRGRNLLTYFRANDLADLEREGLVSLSLQKNGTTATVSLTEAGKGIIRAMPDDLHIDWFPLPADIAKAKAKIDADAGQEKQQ